MSIFVNVLRLAIGKDILSDGADWVALSSAVTGVSKVLLVQAERLDVDLFCTASTLDLWEHHGYPQGVCGSGIEGFVLLDLKSCLCSLTRDVVWNER